MDESKEQQLLVEETPDSQTSKCSNTATVSSKEDVMEMEEVWKCSSCQQIYASMWPKCPGCLKSDTHCRTFTWHCTIWPQYEQYSLSMTHRCAHSLHNWPCHHSPRILRVIGYYESSQHPPRFIRDILPLNASSLVFAVELLISYFDRYITTHKGTLYQLSCSNSHENNYSHYLIHHHHHDHRSDSVTNIFHHCFAVVCCLCVCSVLCLVVMWNVQK